MNWFQNNLKEQIMQKSQDIENKIFAVGCRMKKGYMFYESWYCKISSNK